MQQIRESIRLFAGQLSEKIPNKNGTTPLLNRILKDDPPAADATIV
ncbi:MAG TPA: hypothetical protein VFZ33_10555 [Chitinophagaceae bacterium]